MAEQEKTVLVIGHKNPDTDSICSAICYARLKNAVDHTEVYEAKRAGHLNEETSFVLHKFGVRAPEYLKDVRPQVQDIEIRKTKGVSRSLSVRNAWKLMKEANVVTLPVTEGRKLTGLITIGDIARSYFEVYDSTILATAGTQFSSIVETLEGEVITGDVSAYFTNGKVVISAANPEMMENYIDAGDLVILGNRYESQICAIEMNAKCLIVCEGADVSMTIRKFAEEHQCILISTKFDTYTCARLINQSMPISFFMRERDGLITFKTEDFIEDIQEIMAKKRHRDFPIEDEQGDYVGMISRRNLLGAGRKKVILVDHNEKNQAIDGIGTADIREIIDHHRLGALQTIAPVFFRNQPLGCTATIVYQMYHEQNVEIDQNTASLLCSAIISDTLLFRSPTCTAVDRAACLDLAGIAGIRPEEYARQMFKAGSNLLEKSPHDIFYQDFKTFAVNQVTIGVGQVNSINTDEIGTIRDRITEYIENVLQESRVDMAFFMLTDIMEESSTVVCAGNNALSLLQNAFNVEAEGSSVYLKGVVSRKKQLFPAIMEALQQ